MSPDRKKRRSLVDQVRNELFARIMDGRLLPGTRIVELKVADELRTSQGTLREALARLQAEHLIVSGMYRQTRVRDVERIEIADAIKVRAELERMAVGLAGHRLLRELPKLKCHAESVLRAAEQGDLKAYHRADYLFHQAIVSEARNAALERFWEHTRYEFVLATRSPKDAPDLLSVQNIHWQILSAIEQNTIKRAERLITLDVQAALNPTKSLQQTALLGTHLRKNDGPVPFELSVAQSDLA